MQTAVVAPAIRCDQLAVRGQTLESTTTSADQVAIPSFGTRSFISNVMSRTVWPTYELPHITAPVPYVPNAPRIDREGGHDMSASPQQQAQEAANVDALAVDGAASVLSPAARLSQSSASKPVCALGDFFGIALDTLMLLPRRPFAFREFLLQCWFVARVSLVPTLLLAIPFCVLLMFTFNILLNDFGAADYSGTGAAWGTVTQIGPVVTVLVVSGAAATAMCADLGARTIREELDALRVMGINPLQALVVPRILALTVVATLLSSVVILVGLAGSFIFAVFIQHVTPGSFVGSLTTITHGTDVVISWVKAAVFGVTGGLIACYKGITVGGGPAGVGVAVNETVVFTFVALFAINIIATAVGVQVTR